MKYSAVVVIKSKKRLKVLKKCSNQITENKVQKKETKHLAEIFSFVS